MKGRSTNQRTKPSSRSKALRKQSGDDGALMHVTHPPRLPEYAVRHGTVLRFVTNAAVAQDITFQMLLDTILVATSATAGYDLFWMVKVRFVELWASPLLGSAVTVGVNFDGNAAGLSGDARYHTDTSMGVQPAHVKAKPSPKSQSALFQFSGLASAFNINCPSGTVVDVGLTFVQSSQAQAKNVSNALVGATVGAPYWRGLDGLAIATTKFTPVSTAPI
jgi:hypothetical protein